MANELTSYFGIVRREKTVVLFYLGSYDGPFSASNVTVKNTMAILLFWGKFVLYPHRITMPRTLLKDL